MTDDVQVKKLGGWCFCCDIFFADSHGSDKGSPPPDPLYADPNTIEHLTIATGQEYAMVDVKGRKKKQTQEAALYQVRAV